MVFLDFLPAGILLGFLLGGSVSGLVDLLGIRSLWLAYAAITLQIVAFPSGVFPWSTPDGVARGLWLASYVLLAALVIRNRAVQGVLLIGFGQACFVIAVVANGGHMPVTRGALAASGRSYDLHNNSISLVHPHLSWLVDRWAVASWAPFGNVYSIGDYLIGTGLLVTLVVAMGPTRFVSGSSVRLAHADLD
jgi:hypothetical protein